MQAVLLVADAVGSVVAALRPPCCSAVCSGGSFRLVRHPAWSAFAIVLLPALALLGKLPKREFMDMVLVFTALPAIPLWITGREWRKQCSRGWHDRQRHFPVSHGR